MSKFESLTLRRPCFPSNFCLHCSVLYCTVCVLFCCLFVLGYWDLNSGNNEQNIGKQRSNNEFELKKTKIELQYFQDCYIYQLCINWKLCYC